MNTTLSVSSILILSRSICVWNLNVSVILFRKNRCRKLFPFLPGDTKVEEKFLHFLDWSGPELKEEMRNWYPISIKQQECYLMFTWDRFRFWRVIHGLKKLRFNKKPQCNTSIPRQTVLYCCRPCMGVSFFYPKAKTNFKKWEILRFETISLERNCSMSVQMKLYRKLCQSKNF